MILSANGIEVKIETLGKNINISASAEFDRKSLSGQTSSSAVSAKGNKPKKVSVSMVIDTRKAENLTKLMEIAEALDEKNNPIIYTVADPLCQAMNIRQVIFNNSVNSKKDGTLEVYNVNFSLQESNSVAEKKEEREKEKAVLEIPQIDGEVRVGSVDHAKIVKAAEL
ncbi:MAG: hypothetical protein KAS17_07715 [Victivallaceae bacterium]|nr:hypothetical protein [Victivallaceae bacterium]